MKFIILLTLLFFSSTVYCQKSDSLISLELNSGDTLIIDVFYKTCRSSNGDRLLVIKSDTLFSGIYFKEFHFPTFLDGRRLIGKELQDFFILENKFQNVTLTTKNIQKIIDLENKIIKKQRILNSDSEVSGDYLTVMISLKNKTYGCEQKGGIDFSLIKYFEY